MAISTYTELQTAVADWLHRTDMTSVIQDCVALAEERFNRRLRTRQQETALKEKKIAVDAAAKADELALKEKELAFKAAQAADELELKGQLEGVKVGAEIAKAQADMRRNPKGGNTK